MDNQPLKEASRKAKKRELSKFNIQKKQQKKIIENIYINCIMKYTRGLIHLGRVIVPIRHSPEIMKFLKCSKKLAK